MILHVFIVDDEPKNRSILRELLNRYCADVAIAGEAGNITEALSFLQKTKPDVLLLDIEMPGGNGFDLLDQLKPVTFEVVFITAFDEYAVKAFKYSALDYLLKPVSIEELQTAIEKVRERRKSQSTNGRLSNLTANRLAGSYEQQKIALELPRGGFEFVNIIDILYCESKNGYTHIVTTEAKKFISSRSLKEFEELLPGTVFCRIHYSFLVNVQKIKKYKKGRGGSVEMADGRLLDVAARRKEQLLALLHLKKSI